MEIEKTKPNPKAEKTTLYQLQPARPATKVADFLPAAPQFIRTWSAAQKVIHLQTIKRSIEKLQQEEAAVIESLQSKLGKPQPRRAAAFVASTDGRSQGVVDRNPDAFRDKKRIASHHPKERIRYKRLKHHLRKAPPILRTDYDSESDSY